MGFMNTDTTTTTTTTPALQERRADCGNAIYCADLAAGTRYKGGQCEKHAIKYPTK
jgi:hypothetical protein